MSTKITRYGRGFYFDGDDLVLESDQLLLPNGSVSAPSIGFASASNTGIYLISSNRMAFVTGGERVAYVDSGNGLVLNTNLYLGENLHLILINDGDDTLALRRTTNPQTFKLYETYTDANNYERYALIASGNQLEIKAETLGTGSDNLDIALTPAGTGNVKFGTYGAEVALVAGYITIKDAGGTPRKLAVIA